MTKPGRLLAICATICLVFVLALAVSVNAYHGAVSKTSGAKGNAVAIYPPPPDDDDDGGNVRLAIYPPPPDDDDDGGNVRIASVFYQAPLQ